MYLTYVKCKLHTYIHAPDLNTHTSRLYTFQSQTGSFGALHRHALYVHTLTYT